MKRQQGFTLIELVMVIVILGILSAFALPRFADLGSEARVATVKGAVGAVKSAAAISHSKWLASGETGSIDLEGAAGVTMSDEGYPTADEAGIVTAAQIGADFVAAADGSNFTISAKDGDGSAISGCSFSYDATTGAVTYTEASLDSNC